MERDDKSNREYTRNNLLIGESKRLIPLLILITILFTGYMVIYKGSSNVGLSKYGIGNPYNCRECKELGFACKEHREFDLKESIDNKLEIYAYRYVPNGTEDDSKEWMYGYGFNKDCDFCNELGDECYSCKYDRQTIDSKLKEIEKDELFITKLNVGDSALGYANSSDGRAMLYRELKNKFNSK